MSLSHFCFVTFKSNTSIPDLSMPNISMDFFKISSIYSVPEPILEEKIYLEREREFSLSIQRSTSQSEILIQGIFPQIFHRCILGFLIFFLKPFFECL